MTFSQHKKCKNTLLNLCIQLDISATSKYLILEDPALHARTAKWTKRIAFIWIFQYCHLGCGWDSDRWLLCLLWALYTGWLMLWTIWITEGLEVKFELPSTVIDNVLAIWAPTSVPYYSYCSWHLGLKAP